MEKVKVYNDRNHNVGLTLQNGTERVVQAKSYTLLTREDIDYLASIAPDLFIDECKLRLEDRKLAIDMGFIQDENAPMFDSAEIKKQLSGSAGKLRQWLHTIEKPFLLDEVFEVVKTMDLPASKLQILQEKFPDRALIEIDSEKE